MALLSPKLKNLFERATVAYQRGALAEALALYQRVLDHAPRDLDVLHRLAMLNAIQGRWNEALQFYDAALKVAPKNVALLNSRGLVLRNLGRLEEALQCADATIRIAPLHPNAWSNRGIVLHKLGRYTDALDSYWRASAVNGTNADLLKNQGLALLALQRFDEALEYFDRSLALRPDDAEILTNQGVTLREMGRPEDALQSLNAAVQRKEGFALAHWNIAVTRLLLGDYEVGWQLYEWRKRLSPSVEQRDYPQPLWTGSEDVRGKSIFLYSEQGLGDTIMFFRFVTPLVERGAKVSLAVQPKLLKLLGQASPKVDLLPLDEVPANFDYHIALPSLASALNVRGNVLPDLVPYLRADPERVRLWSDKLGNFGFKIGISWQGATTGAQNRAIPPEYFKALQIHPSIRLISLQKGGYSDEALTAASGLRIELLPEGFDEGENAFLDSAAIMQNLDLVITLDSAIAHCAGAMGRPVWIALPHVPEWRWGLAGENSRWYPSATLFRQQVAGNWQGLFEEIAARLHEQLSHP